MGLFYLLTLFLTIRGASSPRPGWWYTSSVITCALAVATKPIAVTAPAIVLIYDRLFLAQSWRELFRLRWALYLGFVATWLWLALLLRNAPPAEWSETAGSARAGIPALTYALTQPGVILRYLRLSIWPWQLSLEYDWPVISRVTQAIPSLTVLTGVVLVVAFFSYRQVAALFLGAWFFLILLPTSSFIPISDVIAEHRMYLPLTSVIALLVLIGYRGYRWLVARKASASRLARAMAVMLVVTMSCALGYGTYQRNSDYSTAVTVLGDAVAKHPNNARAQINLAALLTREGHSDAAISHLQRALIIKPDSAEAYVNLGVIEYRRNRPANAIADYEKSLALNPNAPATHDALGAALLKVGEIERAIREHQKAIELKPDFPDAYYNLGLALAQAGRVNEAIDQWQRLLELEPGSSRAHKCLAIASLRRGDFSNAVEHLELAVAASPTDIDSSSRLAWLLATSPNARVRNGGRALAISQHANEIAKGRDLEVLRALAAAYAETGQFAEATEIARRAIALAKTSGNDTEMNILELERRSYEGGSPWRDTTLSNSSPQN
jgi:tetratricopeptide (TPR) repeat protein